MTPSEVTGLEEAMSSRSGLHRLLTNLIEHAGWDHFRAMIEEQKSARLGQYAYTPLKSMDDVPAQEFLKGEISGLGLSLVLVHTYIEQLKAEIEVSKAKLERENELEEASNAATDSPSRVDGSSYG